jgi:hypothetical protein
MIIAPRIDEYVGFLNVRAMRAVQSYEVDGVPVRSLADQKFQKVTWRAYHQDIPFQTFVECVGSPRSGGPEQNLMWYVEERPRWDRGPSLRIITLIALNDDARQLTPLLFDPEARFSSE